MALVNKINNRKVSLKSKKLSQAVEESRYDSKYFENKETLLKKYPWNGIIINFTINFTI